MGRSNAVVTAALIGAMPLPAYAADGALLGVAFVSLLVLALPIIFLVRGIAQLSNVVHSLKEHDALTGLLLPAAFIARATELVKQPANDGMRAFPLIVELDDVQNLTDAYGAIAVDEVLIALTAEIANTVGQSNGPLISRWSSHRIAALLRARDRSEAGKPLSALRKRVSRMDFRFGEIPITSTISVAFGDLPGSRGDDVAEGFNTLVQLLDEKPVTQFDTQLESATPVRQKRLFIRDATPELAHARD